MFWSYVYDETWWPMFNVDLSYKPPSSWRMLSWSGGLPRQFTRLKRFRDLVIPGGGCRKGVILQGRQLKCRFSCGSSVTLEKKRGCNRIVCTFTHIEESLVQTDGQKVYLRDHTAWTPSCANLSVWMTPPGTCSAAPLQREPYINPLGQPLRWSRIMSV